MKFYTDITTRELFEKNGYRLINQKWGVTIESDSSGEMLLSVLAFLAGVGLLVFAVNTGSWKLGLVSIILIGLPFTSRPWASVISVSFNESMNQLKVVTMGTKRTITWEDSPEIVVDHEERSAFVSPFEEGNSENHYRFKLKIEDHKPIELFRLKSRQRMDDVIKELVADLKGFGLWS